MSRWLPSFGVPVLCLLLLPLFACDDLTFVINANGPAPLNANIHIASFDVEPSTLRVEALPGWCGTHAPRGMRLGVTIHGDQDLIVSGLHFSYEDRTGASSFPEVIPIPNFSAPVYPMGDIPSASPVTIPGAAPLPTAASIPIPGASPITGVLIYSGSPRRFDYFLKFGCIVIGGGEVVVYIDTADRNGRVRRSHVRARVEG